MSRISILMSVYNKGEFLGQAISSILEQSFTDFEFIIKDNQSADNSVEVVTGFSDPRIRFARNSRNLGPVGSLNNCIEEATGEFVTFAHGDDVWDKDFLATNISYMNEYHAIDVSHSLMHNINEQGIVTYAQPVKGVGDCRIEVAEEAVKKFSKGCYVNTPTAFFRRTAIKYYDIRYIYTCDWDMFLRIAADGNGFLFINKPLLSYRVTNTSETAVGMKSGDLILESYLTLRNFFKRQPEYCRYRNKAFRRLSDSIMRRSRDVIDRDTLYFFMRCAILCNPLKILSPIFHFYLLLGLLFGPCGVRSLKKLSKSAGKLIRKNG